MRTGFPADAYWFSQFGFKMGQVSEEKKRDYGFGIPFWSPYNRPKEVLSALLPRRLRAACPASQGHHDCRVRTQGQEGQLN